MKPHKINEMRHRVELLKPISEPDNGGGAKPMWHELGTFWAAISSVRGKAQSAGGAPTSTVTHKITMRYDERIHAGFSILHEGRLFDVVSVHDFEESKKFLILNCVEKIRRKAIV